MYAQGALYQLTRNDLPLGVNYMPMALIGYIY